MMYLTILQPDFHFRMSAVCHLSLILLFFTISFLATICSRNVLELGETAAYSSQVFDGSFAANHDLVNGRKCYEHTSNSNYQILWDNDFADGSWVIRDANGIRFFSQDNVPCPDLANWTYLPDGDETADGDMISAGSITFGGTTPGEKEESAPESDPQCCQSSSLDSVMIVYNAATHVCCASGASETSVDQC